MKVRWGLIGCGDIARKRVAPALVGGQACELIAVSRARSELAASFARQFGAPRWYSDWRDMLRDDEIDAVYIATPVNLHREQTTAAADAGKHVLCEKPMALTVKECDLMIAACARNNVTLGIAYYRHFYPVVARIREIVASDEIGKPVLIEFHAFERFNPSPGADRYWLLDPEKAGGGPMMDFGCHRIEILVNLFGDPQLVKGINSKALFSRDVEDTATALLGYASGMQAIVSVTHAALEPRDALDIYGSKGSLHIPVLNEGTMRVVTGAGERVEKAPPDTNIHLPLIEDFTAAVLEKRQPGVDGSTGKAVAEIVAALYAE